MIIRVRADLECDRCKVVATIFARNLMEVRPKARAQGWGISPSNQDWCVNCMARHQKEQKP